MKPPILVTREVFDETLEFLSSHCEVESNQEDTPVAAAGLLRRLPGKAGVVCTIAEGIDTPLLERCPGLRAVANIGVGYNNIDIEACTARGILVTNTPAVLDESTADFAWALLLATARRITEVEARLRAGEWSRWQIKQWMGVDVHHATLGIIGMGRIGQAIARRAAGFEMSVIYCNRNRLDPAIERRLNATRASREELLARADFVVLQVPYTPETRHLVGAAELRLMKPSAILVNTARGGVVDDAALVEALANGTLRGAGLDVYENEPKLHPGFLELRNVVLAPHVASSTEATRRAMAMTAARNLVAALAGEIPPNLVNPQARRA